ncbi:hypothetical protein Van01_20130 [Micromonospora andamanensis]|uniref:PPE family protein n=1 Tax=Micromonospora andamanensis TaxID=1287068 RepID=A0ABQ4HT12_9ACTN|nr:hypothetical protein Van01_20130 [Micromonospora andamanensis]
MREPGVGRTSGLTDWHLMNVADMWACLQSHPADNHWRHVAGWRKVAELSGQHLGRLRRHRERLAHAWPPDTNAASHAYLAKLDELIEQVQRTHDAAATNQTALSAATQALTSSRAKIQEIYDEYASKLQQRRSWEQTAADPKAAAASRAIQPPVSDSDLEKLNAQARTIMYGLSTELQQAQTQLRHPPAQVVRHGDRTSEVADPYSSGAAPLIPPISPAVISSPTTVQPPATPMHYSPGAGPVLGSMGATPAPASTDARTPTPPSSSQTAMPAPEVAPSILGSSSHRVGHGVAPSPGQSVSPHTKRPANPRSLPQAGQPQNGVIGGIPSARPTQPTPGSNQVRHINPIGGVIGGGPAGTAPTGGAGSRPANRGLPGATHSTAPGGHSGNFWTGTAAGYRNARALKTEDPEKWDPDQPWRTIQGVEPVLLPPEDQGPMDPGPAIGFTK